MKMLRYLDGGTPRLGVLSEAWDCSLTPLASRYPTMLSLIAGGSAALEEARSVVRAGEGAFPLENAKLLAPVERPGKYLASA